ncbi:MAG: barstar family protein, partial [Actinomycetota bacterium]
MTGEGQRSLPRWELLGGETGDAGEVVQVAHAADAFVRLLDGRFLDTEAAIFGHLAAAFQFPWYFGDNWHAFDECFGEIGEQVANGSVVVVIKDGGAVRGGDPKALADLVTSLGYAGAHWAQGEAVSDFTIVVQVDEVTD